MKTLVVRSTEERDLVFKHSNPIKSWIRRSYTKQQQDIEIFTIVTLNSQILQPNPHEDGPESTHCATDVKPQKGCFARLEKHMTSWHHQGVCLSAAGLRRCNRVICETMFRNGVTDTFCTFDQNRNFAPGVLW